MTSEKEDYDLANEEVEKILGRKKPKNFGEGLTSGIGYILRGAIGACGALVVRTVQCLERGYKWGLDNLYCVFPKLSPVYLKMLFNGVTFSSVMFWFF